LTESEKAKSYLMQVVYADESVKMKLEQIERLDALSKKCTSVMTGMPRGGSGSDFTKIRDRMIEESLECERQMQKLLDLKEDVRRKIDMIQDRKHRVVLEMRYLNCATWESIAESIGRDVTTAHRWHGQALKDFAKLC